MLDLFPKIRCSYLGSGSAIQLEIRAQLLGVANGVEAQYAELRDELFPVTTQKAIKETTLGIETKFKKSRVLFELSAEMENVWKTGMAELQRLLDAEGLTEEVRRRQARTMSGPAAAEALRALVSMGETPRELCPGLERLAQCIEEEGDAQSGFESFLGVKGLEITSEVPQSDLKDVANFFMLARQEASSLERELGTHSGDIQSLVRKLNPYQCPGFSLRVAVKRARARHPKQAEAGDWIDDDHLVFAPYANIAIVDKRTIDFAQQEVRRDVALVRPGAAKGLRKAGTLEQLDHIVADLVR